MNSGLHQGIDKEIDPSTAARVSLSGTSVFSFSPLGVQSRASASDRLRYHAMPDRRKPRFNLVSNEIQRCNTRTRPSIARRYTIVYEQATTRGWLIWNLSSFRRSGVLSVRKWAGRLGTPTLDSTHTSLSKGPRVIVRAQGVPLEKHSREFVNWQLERILVEKRAPLIAA